MTPEDFAPEQRSHLQKTLSGAWAFLPPPLPPQLQRAAFALDLGATAAAIGELKGAARRLANPDMLIGPLVQKEALTSSAMEGTITTIESMIFEQAAPTANTDENAREASNYVRAIHSATRQMKDLPISHRLIKDAHRALLSGLSPQRGQGKRPGEYKQSQNAIGRMSETEHTARYVPPPPAETASAMDGLERYINREDRKPGEALIDLALVHYQFEAIHPFLDGNGRLGRMLVTLLALQTQLLDLPLLHISAEIEKDKEKYIEQLFQVSTQAKWEEWIIYFFQIVKQSCEIATKKVDQILLFEKELKQRTAGRRRSHRLNTLIESLFTQYWISVPEAQKICGTHFQTAQADLQELENLGILTAMTSGRPLIYMAREIWALSSR